LTVSGVPDPVSLGEQLTADASLVWQTVRPRFVYATAYGINPGTGSSVSAALQAAFDAEAPFTTICLIAGPTGFGTYRFDTTVTISQVGQHLTSDAGPCGVPESGDTPTTPTLWTTHGVVVVTNQAIYPVTLDFRNSAGTGGDWRAGGVTNIAFGDYSTSHNTSPGAISLVSGHYLYVEGCQATQFRNTTGAFIRYNSFVANAVQYAQIHRNTTDKMGFAAIASGTNRNQDIDASDNIFYGDNNTLNGPTNSRGWDLSNLAAVRVKGGATQFWAKNFYLDEDSTQLYGVASEVQSAWTSSAVIQIHVTGNARWTRIIGGDVINIAGSAGGIQIDSGALETEVLGTKRNVDPSELSPVTADNGTRTKLSHRPTVTTSSALTLDGRHHVIDCGGAVDYDLDLPPAARASGREYIMINDGSATVSWDPNGTEHIDGSATSVTVAAGNRSRVISDGTEWWTV
jgi:hypothetical protein